MTRQSLPTLPEISRPDGDVPGKFTITFAKPVHTLEYHLPMSKQKRRPVRGGLTVRAYAVLDRAIEDGVELGWMRAHKHVDNPDDDVIKEQIAAAVLGEIGEWFAFDEDVSDETG